MDPLALAVAGGVLIPIVFFALRAGRANALSDADERIRMTAAAALGRLGSVSAVLPLKEAADRFGGDLHGAARQAVAQIQSRLSGAAQGQLTVAAQAGGAVSIAGDGGEVSLDVERDR